MSIDKTAPRDNWIPTKEGMPKKDGFYLVSLDLPTDEDEIKVTKTWFVAETNSFPQYGKVVVAWQPLPKPYRKV